jgi:EAL domain-containing protein (putative c-di-GMP-specific phosphodiesterase class I)
MSLADEAVVSVETSARWVDPVHGDITSAELVAIAEDSGLQFKLCERVMQAAVSAHAEWKRHVANPPPIAVGITSGQLSQLESFERFADLIRRHGARPTDLELNFRESGAAHSKGLVRENLIRLRNLGIKIMLDDVGAGTSRLSHWRDLPISGVRIDRSVVAECMRDARTLTIVTSMIETARSLGVDTAAKGIDSKAMRTWMGHLGCSHGQGSLFGPLSQPDLLALFRSRPIKSTASP